MAEDKKFAVLSNDFVKNIGDESGLPISNDIASALAEDATYRIREVLDLCTYFMRHSNRNYLKTDDLTKSFYWNNIEKPWGADADSVSSSTYTFVSDANVYIEDNTSINLFEYSLSETKIPVKSREIKIKKDLLNKELKMEYIVKQATILQPSKELIDYYQMAVSIVLGENPDLFNEVLKDVQTNSKIFPIVSYFVNFFSGINAVSHDIEKLCRMLQIIKALLSNKFLNCEEYLQPIVSAILYVVLEPLTVSMYLKNDHWKLRDFGAHLISFVMNDVHTPVKIKKLVASSILNIINDPTRPLCSHYGAIRVVFALGEKCITSMLLPVLITYIKNSLGVMEEDPTASNIRIKEDASKLFGVITDCVVLVLNVAQSQKGCHPVEKMYPQLSHIFGETLASRSYSSNKVLTPNERQISQKIRESVFKHVLFNSSSSDNSPKCSFRFYFPSLKKHENGSYSNQAKNVASFDVMFERTEIKKPKTCVIKVGKSLPLKVNKYHHTSGQAIKLSPYHEVLKKCNFKGRRKNNHRRNVFAAAVYTNFLCWVI